MDKISDKANKLAFFKALDIPDLNQQASLLIKDYLCNNYEDEAIEVYKQGDDYLVFDQSQAKIIIMGGSELSGLLTNFIDHCLKQGKYLINANATAKYQKILASLGFKTNSIDKFLDNEIYHLIYDGNERWLKQKVKAYIDRPLGFLHEYQDVINVLNRGYFLDGEHVKECIIVNEDTILEQFEGYIIAISKDDSKPIYIINKELSYQKDEVAKQLKMLIEDLDDIIWQ
ncbi:MAG: hypothetical protein MR210_03815 [Erysipelotrichaceae bacterium]|nr:hypothetical protein [Erysipelotrichaceae bacterium]MDY5251386.1 hypothetical protein [Erysipelotrichaceae bacterium]